MFVEFDDFAFNTSRGVLSRSGTRVPLSGVAAEVLRILVEGQGQTVTKDYLLERVWKGRGTESSLTTAISQLRLALGDSREDARYIRTHHRIGYAFTAAVTIGRAGDAPPQPHPSSFVLQRGLDRPTVLLQGENVLGRDTGQCTIWVSDPQVSRRHACIVVNGKQAKITDLASSHGTFVGGRRITGWSMLANGDEIQFGARGPKMTFRSTDTETVRTEPDRSR
jgi:DNA-binding winged helix-turn-helix (wHTH) protein